MESSVILNVSLLRPVLATGYTYPKFSIWASNSVSNTLIDFAAHEAIFLEILLETVI